MRHNLHRVVRTSAVVCASAVFVAVVAGLWWSTDLGSAPGTLRPAESQRVARQLTPDEIRASQLQTYRDVLAKRPLNMPPPRESVEWLPNIQDAMKLAQQEGRPVFVTMRCLPCKQCSEFDKTILDGGPELDPLLKQFVTVRVTDAFALDWNVFPVEGYQDTDLSWWGWFLNSDGELYGIFGGRDHISDATRISEPALINTLERVLKYHYAPERKNWPLHRLAVDLTKPAKTAKDQPGFASWAKNVREEMTCLHCHQVGEVLRQPALDAKTFDKKKDLAIWPLPENVGITLERDHGLLVKAVAPGSPAAKAGLKAGDILAGSSTQRFFGQTDFRGVLHRDTREDARILLFWQRKDNVQAGMLDLSPGWRNTILDWRMSVSQGNIGAGPGFFPLKANEGQRKQYKIAANAMAVVPYTGRAPMSPAHQAGLRSNHVITAVNGQSPDLIGRPFLVWFRLNIDPGDPVTFQVANPDGSRREIRFVAGHNE